MLRLQFLGRLNCYLSSKFSSEPTTGACHETKVSFPAAVQLHRCLHSTNSCSTNCTFQSVGELGKECLNVILAVFVFLKTTAHKKDFSCFFHCPLMQRSQKKAFKGIQPSLLPAAPLIFLKHTVVFSCFHASKQMLANCPHRHPALQFCL